MTASQSQRRPGSPGGAPVTSLGSGEPATASGAAGPGISTAPASSLSPPAATVSREELNELSEARGVKVLTKVPVPPHDPVRESRAGVYELTAMLWDERVIVLVPHPVTGVLVESEHFVRHRQGDLVHLSDAEARRLLAGDAVVVPGEREEQAAEALRQQIARAQAEIERTESRRRGLQEVAERSDDPEALWRAGKTPQAGAPTVAAVPPAGADAQADALAEAERALAQQVGRDADTGGAL